MLLIFSLYLLSVFYGEFHFNKTRINFIELLLLFIPFLRLVFPPVTLYPAISLSLYLLASSISINSQGLFYYVNQFPELKKEAMKR